MDGLLDAYEAELVTLAEPKYVIHFRLGNRLTMSLMTELYCIYLAIRYEGLPVSNYPKCINQSNAIGL